MAEDKARLPAVKDGWFREFSTMWPHQAMTLEIEECILDKQSKYQHIEIFKTKAYGMMLVLDGVIQTTDRDEFSYQEMISHLPLFSHPCPKKVLIIGGGDGGVLREVMKHQCVEEATLCDIDGEVIEAAKKYLPNLSVGFDNPRAKVHVGDGFKYMEEHENEFDVIITDSSDPVGPAASLFEQPYYNLMKKALRAGGVVCTQGECLWLHLDLIQNMVEFCQKLYPSVAYGFTTIPTYPSGQIGFVLCSKDDTIDFKTPTRAISMEVADEMNLKYYNSEVHSAAFVLPHFAAKALARNSKPTAHHHGSFTHVHNKGSVPHSHGNGHIHSHGVGEENHSHVKAIHH